MPSPSFHIKRLDARYLVAASEENPSALRRRLDRVAHELLAKDLERRFGRLDERGGPVCFIERLTFDVALDLSGSDGALAGAWASALHESTLRTLSRGGSGVVVFGDRADYLASFLEDLLRGCAWQHWYYDEFLRLRHFAVGPAVVEVLTEDADTGRDALLELTRRGALDLLLSALTDGEVEAGVARCLLPASPRVSPPRMYRPWAARLRATLSGKRTSLGGNVARDAARLYLSVLRDYPDSGPDVNLARFIRDLLRLRDALARAADPQGLLAAVESGGRPAALPAARDGVEGRLLAQLARELGGREAAGLLRDLQVAPERGAARSFSSRYGGVFLLVPLILETKLEDFLRSSPYPEPGGVSKSGLLLYLVALQCLGPINARTARQDAGLALFGNMAAAPSASFLERYCDALNAGMHESFERSFRSYLGRRGGAEPKEVAEWFSAWSEAEAILKDRGFAAALSRVSAALLKAFASKLGAFAESSPQYLSRNFLECRAEVSVSAERLTVRFLTCPLQMVLRMAGFGQAARGASWLGGREVEFDFG